MRGIRRVLALLVASVLLYVLAFSLLLDRPLSLGTLRDTLLRKIAIAAAEPGPRLIILAGSNALFSHSCAVIGVMLALPCINGGVALGLGLDYQFALWEPQLRPGDTLYLPMELAQYAMPRGAAWAGPDNGMMLREDRSLLLTLRPPHAARAVFSGTLPDAVAALVEMAAVALHPALARPAFTDTDSVGDGIGHTLAKAQVNRDFLAHLHRPDPSPAAIRSGFGTREIRAFLRWARAHDVQAIGGDPTEFADAPPDPKLAGTLADIYAAEGARFLPLAGSGRYKRADFFDAQDHLVTECQALHSIRVAQALSVLMHRTLHPPPLGAQQMADRCP